MKKWFLICMAAVCLIMVILFTSSSETYEEQSLVPVLDRLLADEPFKEQLQHISFDYAGKEVSIAADGYSGFIEFFIRKAAHFLTYFGMGALLYAGLRSYFGSRRWCLVISLLLPLLFAASDEFHQSFTGGRTPLVQDVILDFIGATCGVFFIKWAGRKKTRKSC
ncbi:VanZ family protein [Listeria ilorinensis]|uniref:VanZ family protein n=1 Tax=Listeria ilorinensis TaxID=2867439 RepID=UPI001EF5CE23|nr:VanZ family protein [Listeria ilorinensis]